MGLNPTQSLLGACRNESENSIKFEVRLGAIDDSDGIQFGEVRNWLVKLSL